MNFGFEKGNNSFDRERIMSLFESTLETPMANPEQMELQARALGAGSAIESAGTDSGELTKVLRKFHEMN